MDDKEEKRQTKRGNRWGACLGVGGRGVELKMVDFVGYRICSPSYAAAAKKEITSAQMDLRTTSRKYKKSMRNVPLHKNLIRNIEEDELVCLYARAAQRLCLGR